MSVLNPNSDEEPLECPLCMEYLELDDINFFPCSCGYQICRFCWNRLRVEGNGLCPACRGPYSENPADFKPLTRDDMAKIKAEKRQKDQAKKQKVSENRKHLANVRVVQKNLVFVVGLSPRLSDAEVLRKHEYFGKFGKIHKVVINTSTAYAGNQNQGPSASAYVTYYRSDDALRAIQVVNNIFIDGRTLKASLGTTKYCSHFMKNQPCPKPDCMYLHELGDEAASFTKEGMQQGKHTEYEKNLHEEMINNESSSSSSGGGGSHSTTTATTTAATSGGSGTTNTLTTTTNGHHHHQPNQRAPTTTTTTTPGDKQTNDNSRINSNLNDNDTSNSAPPGKQKQRQSSGTAGHSRNVIVTNNLNSTKSPPQQPPPPASTPPTPSGEQALTNGVMASSRTPSPKSGVSSGSSVTSSSQGVGGSDGGSNQLMSNSSTASVTSSASSGSTSSAMSASVPVSGLPVSRSGDVEGASPNERCWPPTSSTSNANSSDGVNSVPTSASLSRTDYPHRDEESPIDFASQLSNSGEATSSGMGSQTAKTDLPPSLDPIHRGQTPTEHQSSIATDIRDQGSWDHLVSRTVDHPTGGLQLKETDDMFGGPEDDGLGFDPFHETQKALAEMLESESNDWPGPSPVNQLHQPVQQGSVSASGDSYPTSHSHQSSFGGSQQQQSSTHTPQSTTASTTAPPPGLGGPPTNRAATSGGGAKQPPPGFNMMNAFGSSSSSQNVPNLLSEMHGFGGLDSFAGSGGNSGHIGNVNGFHGGNGRETDGFGFGSTHHNPHPSHARFGGLGQTHPRNPSGGSGGLHGFPPHHSQSDVVNRSRPDSGSSSGGGNALDHLQQQFRQMAMQQQQHHQHPDSSNKVANSKDWQEGFRALLPNVNVSFGALPGSGGGGSNGSQVGHHESVTHSSSGRGGSDRLHYGDMPEGSSRFNNLPTSSSSSNGGVGQQLSGGNSHNMLNEVLGVIPGGGSAALNGHLDRALHHQHHHQQQNIRQNSGWHGLGGGHGGSNHSNHGGNDWGVMDPAIVGAGGQLSGDGGHGGGGHHGVHGGGHHQSHHNHHQARADSPPNWIKANLEQLTSDSGSTGFNLLGGGGGGHNAFSLASPPPPPGGNHHAPSSQHRCEVQQQGGGNGGLAGWLANTPPPGFSLNSRTLAHQQAAQQQQNQHVPFSLSGVGGPAGAVNASDLESEFQRLIHSK